MKKLFFFLPLLIAGIGNVAFGQTGYSENFSGGTLPTGYLNSSEFTASVVNQQLQVVVNKGSNYWDGYNITFSPALNISANPYVSFKIKGIDATQDFNVTVFMFSGTGTYVESAGTIGNRRITSGTSFTEVNLDLINSEGSTNFSAITWMQILIDGGYGFTGTIVIDDIAVGDSAVRKPYMVTPLPQAVYISSPKQTITLTGINDGTTGTNAVTLTAASTNTTIIPNGNISIINPAVGGTDAFLSYTAVNNQSGYDTINVTLSAANATSKTVAIPVHVTINAAPTINQAANISLGSNYTTTINLSGIYDGNPETDQQLTLTAKSSNTAVIANSGLTFNYTSDNSDGQLTITPVSGQSGAVTVTVTVTDNGGIASGGINSTTMSFTATVYKTYNFPPTLDTISNVNAFINVPSTVTLTGITDSLNTGGTLTITAVSGTKSVVANPTVTYTQGSTTGTLSFTPSGSGSSVITVTVTNNGGNANNNGNTSCTKTFTVTSIVKPMTGWKEDWVNGIGTAGYGGLNWLSGAIVNGNELDVHLKKTNNTWAAFIFDFTNDLLDLSVHPYICFQAEAAKAYASLNLLCFLVDVNGNETCQSFTLPSSSTFLTTSMKQFALSFNNNTGCSTPADMSAIKYIWFHFATDSSTFNGQVIFSNLEAGDSASCLVGLDTCKMDSLGTYYTMINSGKKTITMTSIYDGNQNLNPVTITNITSSNTSLIPTPTISAIVNEIATLTYIPAANQTGTSTISFTLTAANTISSTRTFIIDVEQAGGSPVSITLDTLTKYQQIDGFGAFGPPDNLLGDAVNDLGMTITRSEVVPTFEAFNDNPDPNVFNWEGYNYSALMPTGGTVATNDFAMQKAMGIQKFISTVWTPPSWMKKNLSNGCPLGYMTDNVLDTNYYAELAEMLVAYVQSVKELFGIDLYGISIQNELEFNEFYNSCQYTPAIYMRAVQVVGKRFAEEGLTTKLYGPENLPAQGDYLTYIDAIYNDPVARNYLGIYAIHNYDPTGTQQGNITSSSWTNILAAARKFPTPTGLGAPGTGNGGAGIPVWMTETSGYNPTWTDAMALATHINRGLVFGNISGWVWWSLESGGSAYGLMNNLDASNPTEPTYHASRHFYKYIRPGAVRISYTNSDTSIVGSAFLNTDKTYAIVLINTSTTVTKTIKIVGSSDMKSFRAFQSSHGSYSQEIDTLIDNVAVLPPNSLTTIWGGKELPTDTKVAQSIAIAPEKLILYPNPASTTLYVGFPENSKEINIYDLSGRVVLSQQITQPEGYVIPLNISSLNQGYYIIGVDGKMFDKFIKE
jgi:glucuronoarabinoxylan endo-1,4-beta-xylanase